MDNAAFKVTKARASLVMAHPFFGSLALRLKLRENNEIDTACCDGVRIEYNAKFVQGLSQSKVQGLIAHEVMHAAMLHHTRRGARNPRKWNIACDYAINSILKQTGFDLPEGALEKAEYSGMSSEHIYSLLPDEPDDGNGNGADPGGDGGVADSPNSTSQGASQSQQNHEESEWKTAVAQAAHVAKQMGKMPAGMDRVVDELLSPVFPWKDVLRRFMTEKCNDDFSWARGNRRFIAQGLYLPSRMSDDAMGEMVVVIDTSGSISQKELNEFGSEIKGIVQDARPSKVRVMYCDARVAHIDEFGPEDDLQFAAHGGGGTDFRPPFEWLAENDITPRALVYLTDGHGPFPEEEADFPVMWVINNGNVVPPHGEHLVLEV